MSFTHRHILGPTLGIVLAVALGAAQLHGADATRPAASPNAHAQASAPIFNAILPSLSRAGIPVYLPAWLPTFTSRVYPLSETRAGGGYIAYLSSRPNCTAHACWFFNLSATRGINRAYLESGSRRIKLGRLGYAQLDLHRQSNYGPTITWFHAGNTYEIYTPVGTTSFVPGKGYPVSELRHVARSLVRVR